jgi:hypothetical protein
MASGNHGIVGSREARRAGADGAAGRTRRGFSLAEVMLAVIILGIGIISIAALFPAGIAQQRQSGDDIMGPIVADSALSLIRRKVRAEDFGYAATSPTISGDWGWSRPGFHLAPTTINGITIPIGSINIFRDTPETISEMNSLWSTTRHGTAPLILITQRERYYPMMSESGTSDSTPQYVWDCMFRRFAGRIRVAIFVYRVAVSGGAGVFYTVPPNPSNTMVPPLPISKVVQDISATPPWTAAWDNWGFSQTLPSDDHIVRGTPAGAAYNPLDHVQCWQEPRQWLLDQNNNIFRVVSRTQVTSPTPLDAQVELNASPPAYAGSPLYIYDPAPASGQVGAENVVTNLWYIPISVQLDLNGDGAVQSGEPGAMLTPVYLTVRDL